MATLKGTTIDSGAGADAVLKEDGIEINSASNVTFNIRNIGAGDVTLQVDGSNVLTSSSVGQDVVLIQTQTATEVSPYTPTINFDVSVAGYRDFMVLFDGVVPVTDNAILLLRASTDSGSSYHAVAGDYRWGARGHVWTVAEGQDSSASDSKINLTSTTGIDNASLSSCVGEVKIFNPSSVVFYKHVSMWTQFHRGSDGAAADVRGGGVIQKASAVTHIQFLFSTGNIWKGTFKLYGFK